MHIFCNTYTIQLLFMKSSYIVLTTKGSYLTNITDNKLASFKFSYTKNVSQSSYFKCRRR